jgi:IS5 family transposase
LAVESVPDATTLLRFRHLLEKHALTQWIFEEINASLVEQGLFMREGTIVDATIVAAAPSTKNRAPGAVLPPSAAPSRRWTTVR